MEITSTTHKLLKKMLDASTLQEEEMKQMKASELMNKVHHESLVQVQLHHPQTDERTSLEQVLSFMNPHFTPENTYQVVELSALPSSFLLRELKSHGKLKFMHENRNMVFLEKESLLLFLEHLLELEERVAKLKQDLSQIEGQDEM